MYKYLKNFSVKSIILFATVLFSSLIFASILIYSSIKVRENSRNDSMEIVDKNTECHALKIEGLINEAMSITRSLAYTLINNKDTSLNALHPSNEKILTNILDNNPDFLQVWFYWDVKVVKPDFHTKYGRVGNSMMVTTDGKHKLDRVLRDTVNTPLDNDYFLTMKTLKEAIGEPYYDTDTKEFKGVLMVSPTVPMVENNKFMGWVGVDIDMKHIQEIIKETKPYDGTIAYLLSAGKNIIAHTDEDWNERSFFDFRSKYKQQFEDGLAEAVKNQQNSFTFHNEQNNEVYVSMKALSIGRDKEMWILVSETPLKDVIAKSKSIFTSTILIGVIGICLISLVIYFIIRSVTKRLVWAVDHAQKISDGDLTSRIEIEGTNELGTLATSLNKMTIQLKNIVSGLTKSSDQINLASSEIIDVSTTIAKSSSSQAASVEEVMASIEEMTANIQQNTDNAKATDLITKKALHGVRHGSSSAHNTVDSINKIAERISIIHEISNQTNILALNAAVEAARAGENGKGFAVVANEVKKLAEKAQAAATEINVLSEEGVKISDKAEKELSLLLPEIEKTAQLVQGIANANIEQSNGASEIQNVVQELNNIAQRNAVVSENLNEKAQKLVEESEELQKLVGVFKI